MSITVSVYIYRLRDKIEECFLVLGDPLFFFSFKNFIDNLPVEKEKKKNIYTLKPKKMAV